MSFNLHIELVEAEGALMRLIGLVERRGFHIAALEKSPGSGDGSTVTMALEARDPARRAEVLIRQIARLLDVRAVFMPEIAALPTHAAQRWRQACPARP